MFFSSNLVAALRAEPYPATGQQLYDVAIPLVENPADSMVVSQLAAHAQDRYLSVDDLATATGLNLDNVAPEEVNVDG